MLPAIEIEVGLLGKYLIISDEFIFAAFASIVDDACHCML